MGIWDALRARRAVRGPQLDGLFALPSAAITLQSAASFEPTGTGAICFRPAQGPAFEQTLRDLVQLLDADDDLPVELVTDGYGFTWLVSRQDDVESLVTDLHTVVGSLEVQGFASQILCSQVPFRDATGRTVALVYLHKNGTFYPFAPVAGGQESQQRDNVLELQVRDLLRDELPVEKDLSRWMALWGAPGL